jgi:mitochondrial fission protein ELM1
MVVCDNRSPMLPESATRPRVWVLLGKGAGGNAQMRLVADALGWPFVEKRLVYDRLERVPNPLRGASRIGLDRRKSDPLEPPWPDLVIGASRRSAPVSRWIKRQSGARIVHLLHTQSPLAQFDLVVTLPQYRLPRRENVLHLSGALNRIPPGELEAAGRRWEPEFKRLPRPWIALVVGGNSSSYAFDPETARRLGREAAREARRAGGSLLVSTTPRTSPESTEAVFASIDVPAYRYAFVPEDSGNPYHGMLALADRFIVTVDSASLPMEACATGKPVQVFEWPCKPKRGLRMDVGPAARIYEALIEGGFVKPARDFDAYHRALRERGLTTRLGEEVRPPAEIPDDLGATVARIRALFPGVSEA